MNRFIYSCLFYLATPLIILRLLLRSLRAPAYLQRWGERFAWYPSTIAPKKTDVVIHAVSVGEVHAAVPLIQQMLAANPACSLLVTTSTPTGSARVTAMLGGKVSHVYLPYDYPGAIKRFLRGWQPGVVVIMETELWPNLIHYCARFGVDTVLANARLSEKSRTNYSKASALTARMLAQLSRVTAQSPQDSERLQALGLPAEKVTVAGNLKFDTVLNPMQVEKARQDKQALENRPVLVAASTRVDGTVVEDDLVLDAFRQLLGFYPDLLLVLVPRHPERFDDVFTLAQHLGLQVARRSRAGHIMPSDQVLLGDTMGEMAYYYGLADIAFVGGSLVPTGCQNIIEPAALRLPVITGPSLYNFQAVSEQLRQAGGMSVVADEAGLMAAVKSLLDDPALRKTMGEAAHRAVQANQGAAERNLAVISALLEQRR